MQTLTNDKITYHNSVTNIPINTSIISKQIVTSTNIKIMELAMCNKVVLTEGSMLIKVVRRTTEKAIRHSIIMKKPLSLEKSTMTIEGIRFPKGHEVDGMIGKSPIFKYKLETMMELGSLIPVTDASEPNSLWKASKELTTSDPNIVLVGQTTSDIPTDYVDYYIGDISNIFGAK